MAFLKANNCFITKSKHKMKKLVLMLAVAFSMSFVACGNKEAAAEAETAAAPEGVEEVAEVVTDSCCAAADSCCADTVVAAAAEVAEAAN